MMPFLGPGIRKVDAYSIERVFRNTRAQKFGGISKRDADVSDGVFLNFEQQMDNARAVYFNGFEFVFRVSAGHPPCSFAIAETDFHDDRRAVPKQQLEVEQAITVLDTETGPKLSQGALLSCGEPASTQYVAAHGPSARRFTP